MKDPDRQSSHQAPSEEPPHGRRMPSDVRTLFAQMMGEAKRRAKRQRKVSRSPLVRLLLVLTITAALLTAATMLYGFYNFPDAPLRQTPGGYAGKWGTPRTQQDYEAFVRWEKTLFIVFPSVLVLGFAYNVVEARQRRKRKP